MEQRTSGRSSSRITGMIGKSWLIAQVSAADWKTEKLQRYWLAFISATCWSSSGTKSAPPASG